MAAVALALALGVEESPIVEAAAAVTLTAERAVELLAEVLAAILGIVKTEMAFWPDLSVTLEFWPDVVADIDHWPDLIVDS